MKLFLIALSLLTFTICSISHGASLSPSGQEEAAFVWTYHRLNTADNRALLDETFRAPPSPSTHGTVGVIPFYWIDGTACILLSRERADGDFKKKAGTYSDLGGKTEAGTVVKDEMAREYREETMDGKMGELALSPERLSNAFLMKGLDLTTKRHIFYLLYPLSAEEYQLSLRLNDIRRALKDGDLQREYLEKDRFFWFRMKDVLTQVKDPTFILKPVGASLPAADAPVKLRSFFTRDFLGNPLLLQILEELRRLHDKVPNGKKAA